MKLSKFNVAENEIPHRMLKYGGTYIAENYDDESQEFVWAVLSKRKGVYHFSTIHLENIYRSIWYRLEATYRLNS